MISSAFIFFFLFYSSNIINIIYAHLSIFPQVANICLYINSIQFCK